MQTIDLPNNPNFSQAILGLRKTGGSSLYKLTFAVHDTPEMRVFVDHIDGCVFDLGTLHKGIKFKMSSPVNEPYSKLDISALDSGTVCKVLEFLRLRGLLKDDEAMLLKTTIDTIEPEPRFRDDHHETQTHM